MARRFLSDGGDDHPTLTIRKKCFDCFTSAENCSQECSLEFPPPLLVPTGRKYHMPAYFIFLLCILAAAFVFLWYVTILKRYRLNLSVFRRDDAPPQAEDFSDDGVDHPIWYIRTVGLPESVIESISVFKYKRVEGLTEGTDCAVCLTEFQEDESLRLLPKCSHAFHVSCIDTWLRSHKNCPVCRAPVIREANVVVEEDNGDATAASDRETQVENTENDSEPHGEREETMGDLEAGNQKGIRTQSDLGEHRVYAQRPRRSASMGSMIRLSAAEIEERKRNFEIGSSKASSSATGRSSSWYRAMKSSSFRWPLQKVAVGIKRSSSISTN